MRRLVMPLAAALVAAGGIACRDMAARETRAAGTAGGVTVADRRAQAVHDRWVADVDAVQAAAVTLDSALVRVIRTRAGAAPDIAAARNGFHAVRRAFKRVEMLAAYYEPSTTKAINGPALPHVEAAEGPEAVFPPEGLQVLEELLFDGTSVPDAASLDVAMQEVRHVEELITRLRTAAARQQLTDDRVWDAASLELARVVSLGLVGFDSPVTLSAIGEAHAAVDGVRALLAPYRQPGVSWAALDTAFTRALALLDARIAFDDFDRLGFIVDGANPLAEALDAARVASRIALPIGRRAFRAGAVSLFARGAFDAVAFAAPGSDDATAAQVALGRTLFAEPALSGDGRMSCQTCHDPARAFTDGRVRSVSRSGHGVLRNTPSVINAGFQAGAFADLRTTYLEDQVTAVIADAEEMHGSVDSAAARLARTATYRAQFRAAFPADSVVTSRALRAAVAAYMRSLQSFDTPVDRALRGDAGALDEEERRGLNLFMGKAKCATCHFMPLTNGTVPPTYTETEVEVIGVPASARARRAQIDPDSGRFRVTRAAPHLHAFKTPSLRNVALTAPYMHNGVFRTLEEVVAFYNRGGGTGSGADVPNQTLPGDSLRLDAGEARALVRFMRALTDPSYTTVAAPARGRP